MPGSYLVIGEFVWENAPEITIGDSVGKLGSKQIKKEYFQVVERPDGTRVPERSKAFL